MKRISNVLFWISCLFLMQSLKAQKISVTRIDGVGAGNTFLEVSDEMREHFLEDDFDGRVQYLPDQGPVQIEITDISLLPKGEFILTLFDENTANAGLDGDIFWTLTHLNSGEKVTSPFPVNTMPNQEVAQWGIIVKVKQTLDAGQFGPNNGAIGSKLEYKNVNGSEWFQALQDTDDLSWDDFVISVCPEGNAPDPNDDLSSMGDGFFVPYHLTRYRYLQYNTISPAWKKNGSLASDKEALPNLNNVDIVLTSDKTKWSRAVVIETGDENYQNMQGLTSEGGKEMFDVRGKPSVSQYDNDNDGFPDPDGLNIQGMGWFPGYAVDIETGKRLNIFFGENSFYSLNQSDWVLDMYDIQPSDFEDGEITTDLMWNPSAQVSVEAGSSDNFPYQHYLGGQHFIYVTDEEYDECAFLHERFSSTSSLKKIKAIKDITWVSMPFLKEGTTLLSYAEGLIPNDLVIKLRVDNPFQVEIGTGEFDGFPTYFFETPESTAVSDLSKENGDVNVYPNPTSSKLTLSFKKPFSGSVQVFDLLGRVAMPVTDLNNSLTKELILKNFPNGIYWVSIKNENGEQLGQKKIVVQR